MLQCELNVIEHSAWWKAEFHCVVAFQSCPFQVRSKHRLSFAALHVGKSQRSACSFYTPEQVLFESRTNSDSFVPFSMKHSIIVKLSESASLNAYQSCSVILALFAAAGDFSLFTSFRITILFHFNIYLSVLHLLHLLHPSINPSCIDRLRNPRSLRNRAKHIISTHIQPTNQNPARAFGIISISRYHGTCISSPRVHSSTRPPDILAVSGKEEGAMKQFSVRALLSALILPELIIASTATPPVTASSLSLSAASSASSFPSPTPTSIPTLSDLAALAATPIVLDAEEPQITGAPSLQDYTDALQEKYHMTTYWSCVTIATQVHCGWHEPVLPGGDEIPDAAPGRLGGSGMVGIVVLIAGVVGIILR